DRIGHAMTDGEILVEGDVGAQAGRRMRGGSLVIRGSAGPWAGSAMVGGKLEIMSDAGDHLGGPFGGETAGMSGGVIVVRGGAHSRRAGACLRAPLRRYAGDMAVLGKGEIFVGTRS